MSVVHYPFLFDFKQTIEGEGFLAGVKISGGRALMLEEDGQWWMYGVFPSAVAESGSTPNECFLRYMEELKSILFQFAVDSGSYEEFERQMNAFFGQSSSEAELWTAAQQRLRAGKVETAKEDFIQSLPKESPEKRVMHVQVVRLDLPSNARPVKFTAADNVVPAPAMAA